MNWLTRFSLKNVAAILLIVILVTGGGIYTATQLKMESMPDINFPVIVAMTPYPGASPADVDEKVTQPVEKALMGIKGVKRVQSISADSTSVVVTELEFGTDLDKAKQEMRDAVGRLQLPEDTMETSFNHFGFNTFPMISLAVTSEKQSAAELEQWVNDKVKPSLESVDGVGEVQVKGEGPKSVYVRLDPEKLKKHNLSLTQVQQMLQSANLSFPVGNLHEGQVDKPVRVDQKIETIEDLKNVELMVPPNPMEGMQDAFDQIGKGFEGLGQSVYGLGQAVSGLGQGMGQLGQGVGLLQAQVQLLQQAQQLQAQIIGNQLELNKLLNQQNMDPEDPTLKNKIMQLQQVIQGQQNALKQINAQLKQLQGSMPKGGSKGMKSMPKMSAGKKSVGSGKPAVKEVEIKTIKLKDIAIIEESAEDQTLITRTNGKTSVNIDIIKSQDGNVVETAEGIHAILKNLTRDHKDINFIILFDQSLSVQSSIHAMVREGLLGALFASIIILIFLRNFRMTLISIVSIPVSVLATLIFMKQSDITLNIMTLGGLTVAIGRVVDDSIVVIENIYRHMMESANRSVRLIEVATKEVASAITSSTLTTVAVFIPLSFVSGIVGEVFKPFALTVAIALLCSLIVAVTIVPVLAKLMMVRSKRVKVKTSKNRMATSYRKMLAWALNHKVTVLLISSILLVASLFLIPIVGTAFLPADAEKVMEVVLKMPSGTSLDKTNEVAKKIEDTLKKHKEVEVVSLTVGNLAGQLSNDGTIGSANRASMFIKLSPDTQVDQLVATVRDELKPLQTSENAEIQVSELNLIAPSSDQLSVVIKGKSIDEIKPITEQLTEKIKEIDSLVNVSNNLSQQKPIVTIYVDGEKAAKNGLMAHQVALTVRGLLAADKVMELEKGSQSQDVRLGFVQNGVNSIEKLKEVQILNQTGKLVKLGQVAEIEESTSPVTIQKENGQIYAQITGSSIIKDTGAVSREIQKIIDNTKLPAGVEVQLSGTSEEMNKSFEQLGIACLVAIGAVYVVMLITFGEATAPFTILFSLPYAVIGGLVGLYLTDQPISVPAMIGALMLIGIVVTNAIVLIDRVQQMRNRGLSIRDALIEAAGTRLRPILMTAFATIFALLPLGLGYGEGTLLSPGLAVVVIGGLTSSTVLTLFIVPVIYELLVGWKERWLGDTEKLGEVAEEK